MQAIAVVHKGKLVFEKYLGLERRTARSGKDSIDHMPGSHDDIANAVAGAIVKAWSMPSYSTVSGEFRKLPKVILGHIGFKRRIHPQPPKLKLSRVRSPALAAVN